MEYLDAGHSQRQTRETFHISMTAINSWRQKYKKSGSVKDNPPRRKARKLEAAKLKAYVKSHPDAYLKEIGKEFDPHHVCQTQRSADRMEAIRREVKANGSNGL